VPGSYWSEEFLGGERDSSNHPGVWFETAGLGRGKIQNRGGMTAMMERFCDREQGIGAHSGIPVERSSHSAELNDGERMMEFFR